MFRIRGRSRSGPDIGNADYFLLSLALRNFPMLESASRSRTASISRTLFILVSIACVYSFFSAVSGSPRGSPAAVRESAIDELGARRIIGATDAPRRTRNQSANETGKAAPNGCSPTQRQTLSWGQSALIRIKQKRLAHAEPFQSGASSPVEQQQQRETFESPSKQVPSV